MSTLSQKDLVAYGLKLGSTQKQWLVEILLEMWNGYTIEDLIEINCEDDCGDTEWREWVADNRDWLDKIDDLEAENFLFQAFCDPLEGDGELFVGCKCVETQWADGGENTRNEPMVTFKWPGVAKLLQDNIMAWEDEAGLMKSSELRRLANIMDAYVALTNGVPFYKVTLIEILERELDMYKDGLADTACWPGRDPDYEYSVRYYRARVKLLYNAIALLK